MNPQLVLSEANLPDYLRRIGVFAASEEVRVEPAGDGNINWVRRALSPGGRSVVVKQARPALERFPEYEVSTERLVFEARYYEVARPFDSEGVCPDIQAFAAVDRVLVLEDLGAAERLDRALARGSDARAASRSLGRFLGRVHRGTRGAGLAARFRNEAMQRLHGDHIFKLPLEPNEFPLPPRTRERALVLGRDPELRRSAAAAYERYLEPVGALVHADVQAGNVLLTERGPKLLDAEIAHVGDPAFDVGTLIAHLALPAAARGTLGAAGPAVTAAWEAYRVAHGETELPAFSSVVRYAGLEMLRRTIGAARVPVVEDDAAGLRVIEVAVPWIVQPPAEPAALMA